MKELIKSFLEMKVGTALKGLFVIVMVFISALTICAADSLGDNNMWGALFIGIFAPMGLIWGGGKLWGGYDDVFGKDSDKENTI